MIKTEISGKYTRSATSASETELASVGFFFLNGRADALKIIANQKGIDTLIQELSKARDAVEGGRSYLPGDLEWVVSNTTIVAIEPAKYTRASRTLHAPERKTSRIVIGILAFIAFVFTAIGVISVVRAIF